MATNKRQLFRETALQQYMKRKEKDILPQPATPPVFLCCWILLTLLITMTLVAWQQEVPVFANGSGVIQASEPAPTLHSHTTHPTVLLFLPVRYAKQLHKGEKCYISVSYSVSALTCTLTRITPEPLPSETLRARYRLDETMLPGGLRSLLLAEARLNDPLSNAFTEGEPVDIRVQIGTQRLLTLLPGFERFGGGTR